MVIYLLNEMNKLLMKNATKTVIHIFLFANYENFKKANLLQILAFLHFSITIIVFTKLKKQIFIFMIGVKEISFLFEKNRR